MEYPRNDELLTAYLDRELSPDERAAMDRLLERSPEARERLRELEVTSRFVRQLPHHGVPTDLADAVIDRLRSESILRLPPVEPVPRSRRLSWRVSAPIAAAATLLIAVWMLHKPAPVRTELHGTNGSEVASDRWEQVKVGDFFDLVGPDGESQFQLIVVDKQSDVDPVRCFLIEKTDRAEVAQGGLQKGQWGLGSGTSPLALQATRDQLGTLQKAYVMASSLESEPFPIVDINVRADGLAVDDLTAHAHFRTNDLPADLADQLPSEDSEDVPGKSAGVALAARSAQPSPDGSTPTEASRSVESASRESANQFGVRRQAQSTDLLDNKELASNESAANSPIPSATSQAERTQKQVIGRIESVRQRDVPKKPTSESVRELADVKDRRLVLVPGNKDNQPASRVEVLLQLKRHSESEPSDR